jgi:hypothetical protein
MHAIVTLFDNRIAITGEYQTLTEVSSAIHSTYSILDIVQIEYYSSINSTEPFKVSKNVI